jgi:hypothetical protein
MGFMGELTSRLSLSPRDASTVSGLKSETGRIGGEIGCSSHALITSLRCLEVDSALPEDRSNLPWPLNQEGAFVGVTDEGVTLMWRQDGFKQFLRLDQRHFTFKWDSRLVSEKPEGDVTEDDVRGKGRLEYEAGVIKEKKFKLTLSDTVDLDKLKEAEAAGMAKLKAGKKCTRDLDKIKLKIRVIEEGKPFVEEEEQTLTTAATFAYLETTRGWQILKAVELSLLQAVKAMRPQSQPLPCEDS